MTLAVAALAAPAQGATLSRCTFAKLEAAVAKGGKIRVRCDGTVAFTRTIVVAAPAERAAVSASAAIRSTRGRASPTGPQGAAGLPGPAAPAGQGGLGTSPKADGTFGAATALEITGSLGAATRGKTYKETRKASGGHGRYAWRAFGLPSGLKLNSSGGISGKPGATGKFAVTVYARARTLELGALSFTLTVRR